MQTSRFLATLVTLAALAGCGGDSAAGATPAGAKGKQMGHQRFGLTRAQLGVSTIDDCVRACTAFSSFDDLQKTELTYAPTFYGKPYTTAEGLARVRVVSAFNAWAERVGRERRAEVRA